MLIQREALLGDMLTENVLFPVDPHVREGLLCRVQYITHVLLLCHHFSVGATELLPVATQT